MKRNIRPGMVLEREAMGEGGGEEKTSEFLQLVFLGRKA